VKLTTHLHLVPRSRMSEDIPPFPQYALMVWCSVEKTLYLRRWVGNRASLDAVLRIKIPSLTGARNQPVAQRYTTELFRVPKLWITVTYFQFIIMHVNFLVS